MGASARGEAALATVASAVEALLLSEGRIERLDELVAGVGAAVEADRAFVFQNVRSPDGRLWMDLVGEWDADGIRQIFEDPDNHLHPYAPDFSRRIDVYGKGEPVVGLVSDLPEPERTVLAAEDVVSVASVPIMVGSEWWGFLGFDDCSEGRVWDEVDLEALWTTAQALGVMLQRDLDEETRRFSEDQFRSMVEEGPAVVYIDGPDEGASSIYISPQIERVLGYSPDEWYADPDLWGKVLHPDDRSRALAENERHNETGDPFVMEYRMFHKGGHVVWVHDEATMIRDDRGVPRFSHGVMMDI
ncbi:MAG TPA: PAS domain-containing protein, partial [Actinomycetota bacterium]